MDYLAPLWKLLAENAPRPAIRKCGEQIARELATVSAEVEAQRRILSGIMAWHVPMPESQKTPEASSVKVRAPFDKSLQDYLKECIAHGRRTVDTELLHRVLRDMGALNAWDTKAAKVSIGNLVFRTPGWKRVRSGLYTYEGEKKGELPATA